MPSTASLAADEGFPVWGSGRPYTRIHAARLDGPDWRLPCTMLVLRCEVGQGARLCKLLEIVSLWVLVRFQQLGDSCPIHDFGSDRP
jgi:hypothetical protein